MDGGIITSFNQLLETPPQVRRPIASCLVGKKNLTEWAFKSKWAFGLCFCDNQTLAFQLSFTQDALGSRPRWMDVYKTNVARTSGSAILSQTGRLVGTALVV